MGPHFEGRREAELLAETGYDSRCCDCVSGSAPDARPCAYHLDEFEQREFARYDAEIISRIDRGFPVAAHGHATLMRRAGLLID